MKFFDRFKRKDRPAPEAMAPGVAKVAENASNTAAAPEVRSSAANNPDELRLELGDFLHRIPAHLLHPGPHDLKLEVFFSIHELSQRIARGTTTINLVELYRQAPQIFRTEVKEGEGHDVRFPWQKLAAMVNQLHPKSEAECATESAKDVAERLQKEKKEEAAKGKKSAPILRGRGNQQASWFSKTGVDRTQEGVKPPAPEQEPVRGSGFGPADPFAPEVAFRLAPEIGPRPGSLSAEAQGRAADDNAFAKLPQDIQVRIAAIRGDYERRLADLETARSTYAHEVDRLQAELTRLTNERDETDSEILSMQEQLRVMVVERDAAKEMAQAMQKEIEGLREGSRVDALIAERDALLQQKAHLSSQITHLGKRGIGVGFRSGEGGAGTASQQRQVEELQRRIALMENSQRETALELTREKEGRARAEKLLAAAEKLQEQSATYMESTKADIRREIEGSVKGREIETRRIQKELQEQVSALSDQHRTVTLELERARALLAKADQNRQSHPEAVQAQAFQQLESDIENYRERLKVLIRERDEARDELKRAFGSARDDDRTQDLLSERAKLQDEISILQQQYVEHSMALEAICERRLTEENRVPENGNREGERSAILAQREEEERMALKRELAQLQGKCDNLMHERDDLMFQLSEKERAESEGTKESKSKPERLSQGELLPANVIEVSMPEVLDTESGQGIRLARIRPVSVPPPKVG